MFDPSSPWEEEQLKRQHWHAILVGSCTQHELCPYAVAMVRAMWPEQAEELIANANRFLEGRLKMMTHRHRVASHVSMN